MGEEEGAIVTISFDEERVISAIGAETGYNKVRDGFCPLLMEAKKNFPDIAGAMRSCFDALWEDGLGENSGIVSKRYYQAFALEELPDSFIYKERIPWKSAGQSWTGSGHFWIRFRRSTGLLYFVTAVFSRRSIRRPRILTCWSAGRMRGPRCR